MIRHVQGIDEWLEPFGYIVNDVATFESVIPEPTTALLLATGLAALAASQRRR